MKSFTLREKVLDARLGGTIVHFLYSAFLSLLPTVFLSIIKPPNSKDARRTEE